MFAHAPAITLEMIRLTTKAKKTKKMKKEDRKKNWNLTMRIVIHAMNMLDRIVFIIFHE